MGAPHPHPGFEYKEARHKIGTIIIQERKILPRFSFLGFNPHVFPPASPPSPGNSKDPNLPTKDFFSDLTSINSNKSTQAGPTNLIIIV